MIEWIKKYIELWLFVALGTIAVTGVLEIVIWFIEDVTIVVN